MRRLRARGADRELPLLSFALAADPLDSGRPCGSVASAPDSGCAGRTPFSSGRKRLARRRDSSTDTSSSVIQQPEPVGHSTRSESP
jgi:hypothetical protein